MSLKLNNDLPWFLKAILPAYTPPRDPVGGFWDEPHYEMRRRAREQAANPRIVQIVQALWIWPEVLWWAAKNAAFGVICEP